MAPSEKQYLLSLARRTLEQYFDEKTIIEVDEEYMPSFVFHEKRGVFVTLTKHGELRGCMGNLEAGKVLYQAIIENVLAAALFDPRFPPVSQEELPHLKIEISILSEMKKITNLETPEQLLAYLEKKKPGLVIKTLTYPIREATFLPQVWQDLPEPEEFVNNLCLKAGLPADYWKEVKKVEFWEYTAETFQEGEDFDAIKG